MSGRTNLTRQSSKSVEQTPLIKPIYYLLPCLLLPLLLLIMIFFLLMKQAVNIILKVKHGKSYGGILQSSDAVWAIEDISKSIINVGVTLKSHNSIDVMQQVKQIIYNKIFKQPDVFPKLTSIRSRSMGFNYLLKNQLSVDDCVSNLNTGTDVLDRILQKTVSDYSNKPLPKGNSALWEVLISPNPIKRNANDEQIDTFFVLFRFSHIVGDGVSLTNLLIKTFADHVQQSNKNLMTRSQDFPPYFDLRSTHNHTNIMSKLILAVKNFVTFLHIILVSPAIIMYQTYIRKENISILHGSRLSGEKLLVCALEDERKLVSAVKTIKKVVSGSKFSDILITAISASLEKHFKSNSQFIPYFVTTLVTALVTTPNMDQNLVLQNQFSVALLDLPILIQSNSLIHRLQEVMKQTNRLRNSPDYLVNYWLLNVCCGSIPHPILRQILNTDNITMSISNLPGVPKLSILDGCIIIEDIIFYTPHRGTSGVSFTVFTYDNRFQLGLSIDKSILSSSEKAQLIIDDIFKNVIRLYEEVCPTMPIKW